MWIHHLDNKWTVRTSDILKGILSLYLLENRQLTDEYDSSSLRNHYCPAYPRGTHAFHLPMCWWIQDTGLWVHSAIPTMSKRQCFAVPLPIRCLFHSLCFTLFCVPWSWSIDFLLRAKLSVVTHSHRLSLPTLLHVTSVNRGFSGRTWHQS